MNAQPSLWRRYFNDFCFYKMNLINDLKVDLQSNLFRIKDDVDHRNKMLQLHVYLSEYTIDIAKMTTILRSLRQISSKELIPFIDVHSIEEHDIAFLVSKFVIDVLFHALESTKEIDQLKTWQQVYKDTMALPSLSALIYESIKFSTCIENRRVEVTFDVMQTVFVILQSNSENTGENFADGLYVLADALSWLASINTEAAKNDSIDQKCSILASMISIAMKYVKDEDRSNSRNQRLLESLFNHFFCDIIAAKSKNGYYLSDCECFLQIANEQTQWLEGAILSGGEITKSTKYQVPKMPIHVFKFYLSRIMMCKKHTDLVTSPLGLRTDEVGFNTYHTCFMLACLAASQNSGKNTPFSS